jgi:hypothetical protein
MGEAWQSQRIHPQKVSLSGRHDTIFYPEAFMSMEPGDLFNNMTPLSDSESKVHGDFVSGDKVIYENIHSYTGVVIGRGVQQSVAQNAALTPGDDLMGLFRATYQFIRRSGMPERRMIEIADRVQAIEYETSRLPVNPTRLERLLRDLRGMETGVAQYVEAGLAHLDLYPVSKALSLGIGGEISEAAPPDTPAAAPAAAPAFTPADGLAAEIRAHWNGEAQSGLLDCLEAIDREIRKEQQEGGWADLRAVQSALECLREQKSLRAGLFAWLIEGEGIPTSVRLVAKKMLA